MAGTLTSYLRLLRPEQRAQWSIGIYAGPTPFDLVPYPSPESQPVLGPHSLGSIKADGVADPFMVRYGPDWLMFFEVENRLSGRGEVGLATSSDAICWQFQGIVLRESFHLSYPQIFESDGSWYMLPEAASSGATRLYKAESFPSSWQLCAILLDSALVDPTIFYHADRWWILALEGFRQQDALVLYYADCLEGPWRVHRANPILVRDRRAARPAGRMILYYGSLIRFSQDYTEYYGRCVRAFRIEEISPDRYAEREIENREILGASGEGWNATGMHHVDAHELGPDAWIACVDGRQTRTRWPIMYSLVRRILR